MADHAAAAMGARHHHLAQQQQRATVSRQMATLEDIRAAGKAEKTVVSSAVL
jgi:hypothetical protein